MANLRCTTGVVVWFLLHMLVGSSCVVKCLAAQESLGSGEPGLSPSYVTSEGIAVVSAGGADLYDVGESNREFSPRTMEAHKPGQDLAIESVIGNRGDTTSGRFTVRFYLSKDTTISTLVSDSPGDRNYFLRDLSFDPLPAGQSIFFSAYTVFPTEIPGGTYYVGWIIDADNEVTEVDESNNTAYKHSYRLVVSGDVPPDGDSGVVAPLDTVAVIDDFESYTDTPGNRIFDIWIDGSSNGTGSQVGYLTPPFAEQAIVHSGRQSMPLSYDNGNAPFYSETYREFSPIQHYTISSGEFDESPAATDLSVWWRGYPATTTVTEAGGKITIQGEGADIWDNGDQFTYYYKMLNGNGSMVARVIGNGTGSNTWAKGGVMIREILNAGSKHAMMILTGGEGGGAAFQWRSSTGGGSQSAHDPTPPVSPPYWVRIARAGNFFTASISSNGTTWKQQGQPQTIRMTSPIVYIGLCVTSHAAGEYRTFEFDKVATTGNVTGSWQTEEIGLARNSPDTLYVGLQDHTRLAVVVHEDRQATNVTEWTEWRVPLDAFTGVDLSRVRRVYLGVGNRSNRSSELSPASMMMGAAVPPGDSTGMLYFDCITLGGPPTNVYFNGYVRDKSSKGISGAKVTFTCGTYIQSASCRTDGYYSITVPKNRTYTVTAALGAARNTFTLQISGGSEPAITPSPNADIQWTPQSYKCGAIGLDIFLR